MFKRILSSVISVLFASCFIVQGVNSKLSRKAEDHFINKEWKEALSMYEIVLMETPTFSDFYPPTIISAGKIKDNVKMMQIIEMSQNSGIPLDSLFINTLSLCKKINDTSIYENMLIIIKENQPWFKKIVNNYLLKYYSTKKISDKAISIADELLEMNPSNIEMMLSKANILLDSGKIDEAANCMMDVLKQDPSSEEALLFLGNYHFLKGKNILDSITEKSDLVHSYKHNNTSGRYKAELDSVVEKHFISAKSYLNAGTKAAKKPYVKRVIKQIDDHLAH